MKCPRCQHENRPAAKFCEECAAPLARACVNCGAQLSATAKFCPACAHQTGVARRGPVAERFGSPQTYTPKHLADQILLSRAALEGERKQVTVLFVDIVDSSRLAERLEPELMHQVMDRVLRLMAAAVHRCEGTVNQFLGDGLMALFGAPVALEEHALRAVQAAFAINDRVADFGAELAREHGVDIRLRLGLNTGSVVVGRIGDDLRMDYTAVGDTTHLAARVQSLADPGTIVIAEPTFRLVSGYVDAESLGLVKVKGRTEPVHVYRLHGERRRSRLEVRAELGLSPFVGRALELDVIRDRFTRVMANRGHIVGIVGEPGVGKSRLLHELRNSQSTQSAMWLETHCISTGQTTPYMPLLQMLRRKFGISDEDSLGAIRDNLDRGVRQGYPKLTAVGPFLQSMFGVPDADDALRHLDPREKRQRTFEAIRDVLLADDEHRPQLIIVEDLHWIDKTSEDWLAFFVRSLHSFPILLLTTHRPGYSVRWADSPQYTQIALDVLGHRDTETLISALVRNQPPAGLLEMVRAKTEGNPLFIEEITGLLIDRKMLVPLGDDLRWTGTAVGVPSTIQDLIGARIDHLDEPAKRTIQAASVIGPKFTRRLLSAIGDTDDVLEQHLGALKQIGLIHETRFVPDSEYTFKHGVIQETVYSTLLTGRRQALHGAIAYAIEAIYAGRVEEQASTLAYHYSRSDQRPKAVEYALLAGDHALRLNAHAEAKAYYGEALTTANTLGSSALAQSLLIDATVKVASVSVNQDEVERAQSNLEAVRRLAQERNDPQRLSLVLYWLGRLAYVLGDSRRAITCAEESLAVAEQLDDATLTAPPVNLMARAYSQLSDLAKAAPLVVRSVEQMERLGNKTDEATTAGIAAWIFGQAGEFDVAFEYADRGRRIAREIGNPFAEAAAVSLHGVACLFRGDWHPAITDFQQAREIAERAGDLFRVYLTKVWEGWAHASAGDPGRGRRLLDEALALSVQLGTKFNLAYLKANLASSLLALGDLEPVRSLCQEAIDLAEATGEPLAKGLACRTLAEACIRLDILDRPHIEGSIQEAIRLHGDVGAQPELARTYVSYAKLLDAWGETARAQQHLQRAIAIFRQLGMAWDLTRAERALTAL
jgi:class 3 adenylate cyclase/tetratricopeptide (TPR) repeat protein